MILIIIYFAQKHTLFYCLLTLFCFYSLAFSIFVLALLSMDINFMITKVFLLTSFFYY